MALEVEFQEFRDKWKQAAADGKVTLDEIGEVADEAIDLIAQFWDALDKNNPAAVSALQANALKLVNDIIDDLPDGRFLSRAAAKAGAGMAVPWLVESAAKAGQPIREYVAANVGPMTRKAETVLHKFNIAIGA